MIAVDATVALKWLLPQEGSEAALALLTGRERLVAPSLIQVEVAGALGTHCSTGQITEDEARQGWRLFRRIVHEGILTLSESENDEDAALEMAFASEFSLRGCVYIAAAKRLDAELITADSDLCERLSGAWPRIRVLSSRRPDRKKKA